VKALALLGGLTLVAGCGGGSGGTCANAPACDGDVVGTWAVTSSCVNAFGPATGPCPGETATVSRVTVSGTLELRDDLTYTVTMTEASEGRLDVPVSCLALQALTCTSYEASLRGSQEFRSARCGSAGSTCSCSVVALQDLGSTGTYATASPGRLTLQTPTTIEHDDFCASGSTLTLSPHGGTFLMSGITSGTLTLARQ